MDVDELRRQDGSVDIDELKRQDGSVDIDELKRHDGNTDTTDATDKNGFSSACGGKGQAEGESKSVLIRGIRGIRVAIMSL